MSQVESQLQAAMKAAIEHLKQELKSLRTGRANSAVLDKVHVDLYGSHMSLKSLATVTVPEARQILVTPFDTQNIHAIAKAIDAANLGIHARVDGKVVRVSVPPMDEGVRKQIAKQCKDLGEKCKISIRDVRKKFNEQVRKQKADGLIPEDQMKRYEKIIQDHTDKSCKEVDTLCAEKEKEVLTI